MAARPVAAAHAIQARGWSLISGAPLAVACRPSPRPLRSGPRRARGGGGAGAGGARGPAPQGLPPPIPPEGGRCREATVPRGPRAGEHAHGPPAVSELVGEPVLRVGQLYQVRPAHRRSVEGD